MDHRAEISLAPIVQVDVVGHASVLIVVAEAIEIGRAGTGVVVADPMVSRRHLRLEPRADHIVVVDLGSTNGVRVEGRLIVDPQALRAGEMAEFGRSRLTVVSTSPDARSHDRGRAASPSAVAVVMPEWPIPGDSSAYRTIVSWIVDRHGGRVVRRVGDVFVVWFASGADGASAGDALQRAFHAHGRSQPASALRVQMIVTSADGVIEAIHPP